MVKRHVVKGHSRTRGENEYEVRPHYRGENIPVALEGEIGDWWESMSEEFDRKIIIGKKNKRKGELNKSETRQISMDEML